MTWQCSKNQSSQSTLSSACGPSIVAVTSTQANTHVLHRTCKTGVKLICLCCPLELPKKSALLLKGRVVSGAGEDTVYLYNQYLTVSLCMVFPALSPFFSFRFNRFLGLTKGQLAPASALALTISPTPAPAQTPVGSPQQLSTRPPPKEWVLLQ